MKTQTRTIRNKTDAKHLIAYIGNMSEFPLTVTIKPGVEKRSDAQNRLAWQWFNDASNQGDQTAQEYRAYCKLHFGVPILRAEDEEFRAKYDRVIKGMPYETKLELMCEPFDFTVTSLMSVKQQSKYLNAIEIYFRSLGYQLTDPAMMGIEYR